MSKSWITDVVEQLLSFAGIALFLITIYVMFGLYGSIYFSGATEPNSYQSVPLNQHGHVVFVTMQQYIVITASQMCVVGGVVVLAVAAFIVRYTRGFGTFWNRIRNNEGSAK
jgi:hypothetical protein